MKDLYMYVIQVNIALLLFCVLYGLLFANDTFWKVKRYVLLSFLVWSLGYPWMELPGKGEGVLHEVMADYPQLVREMAAVSTLGMPTTVDGAIAVEPRWDGLAFVAGAGSVLLLLRFISQCIQIGWLLWRSQPSEWRGHRFRVIPANEGPFSFFKWIFVNPSAYTPEELDEILAHEEVHVRQMHSLDILLAQWVTMVCWYNPAAWLLQKAIRENLEFLTDTEVLRQGYNRKEYQYHLLRLTTRQPVQITLVNSFTVSPLKKRIMMMNKKQTARSGLIKYASMLPIAGVLLLSAHLPAMAGMADTPFSLFQSVNPQRVKGKVVDEKGQPLPGASIIVKGTSIGTISDAEGNFQVSVQRPGTLCISYIGRIIQQVSFDRNNPPIEVVMRTENNELDKVVVVGLAVNKKPEAAPSPKKEEELVYFVVVEEMPEFPGGMDECMKFLGKNIKYPVKALENNEEGTVYVSFIIDENGEVKNPSIVQSVSETIDAEALRVVRAMPKWKPGMQRNKPVNVLYTLPIDFKIQESF